MKTVTELAELFGVTRQAMNKRVKSLDADFVEQNERGVTVVTSDGLRELERLYGKIVSADAEILTAVKSSDWAETSVVKPSDSSSNDLTALLSSFMADKNAEIDRLTAQLRVKDKQITELSSQMATKDTQIAEKDKQLDQQQQLTAAAIKDREQLMLEFKERPGFWGRVFGRKK